MARSSFGGSGDYSTLFNSLFNQAKTLKDQQQAAADQDAQDRWQNGLMSDEDWLAYIQSRVDGTSSDKDPSQHQKWIDLQRQYITSIADSTAEFSYSSGKSSIGDLIQYYQGRLQRLQSDSEEYRQLSGHLNDLIDQRDSNDLSQGAQAINSKIQVGKATYQDLLNFYKSHLATLRPNSDLYKQVQGEITNVSDTIAQTQLNGRLEQLQYQYQTKAISGGQYAAALRGIASPFKASDPQKYYQLLEAAARVGSAGASGGGGGGGGGGAGSLSKTQKTTEGQLQAVDNYLEMFDVAYKAGARVIPDPNHPGQNIVLTPELMAQVDQQRVGNFDKLATLYQSAGNAKKYTQTLENKTKFVVDYVQPHNTMAASQQWGQLIQGAAKSIAAFKDNPDPEQALKSIVGNLNTMKAWINGQVVQNGKVVDAAHEPTGDFINNSSSFIDQALAALTDPNMDAATRMQTLQALGASLDTDAGANYDKGTAAAMKTLLTQAGAISNGAFDLASGRKVLVITPDEGITLKDVKTQHVMGADPNTGQPITQELQAPDVAVGKGQRLQEVWIDRGGTPTKVFAIVDGAPSPYQAWVAKKAVTINGQTYAAGVVIPSSAIGQNSTSGSWDSLVKSGLVGKDDAFAAVGSPLNYIQVPAYDDNGKHYDSTTYYQDPQTKLWYKGSPPIGSTQLNADGTVKVKDDGTLGFNWLPYAHVGGVAVPYQGSNRQQMQAYMDQGLVGADARYNEPTGYRDGVGNYSADPTVAGPMAYYDPRDESSRASMQTGLSPAAEPQPDAQAQLRNAVAAARQRAATVAVNKSDASNQQIDVSKVAVNLNKLAQGLGISLTNQKDDYGLPVVAPNAAAMAARRNKLQAELSIPTIKAAPIDLPMPDGSTKPGQLSSGPALANLPKLQGQDIDLSKITALPAAPKAPAPAPVTAKTAPRITASPTTSAGTKTGKFLE